MSVSFFIVGENMARHRDAVIAECVAQSYESGAKIAMYFDDADRMRWIDRVLWTFDPASFVAHRIADDNATQPNTIHEIILTDDPTRIGAQFDLVFVEASDTLAPREWGDIIEVVGPQPEHRQQGRKRFDLYRKDNRTPKVHNID